MTSSSGRYSYDHNIQINFATYLTVMTIFQVINGSVLLQQGVVSSVSRKLFHAVNAFLFPIQPLAYVIFQI